MGTYGVGVAEDTVLGDFALVVGLSVLLGHVNGVVGGGKTTVDDVAELRGVGNKEQSRVARCEQGKFK